MSTTPHRFATSKVPALATARARASLCAVALLSATLSSCSRDSGQRPPAAIGNDATATGSSAGNGATTAAPAAGTGPAAGARTAAGSRNSAANGGGGGGTTVTAGAGVAGRAPSAGRSGAAGMPSGAGAGGRAGLAGAPGASGSGGSSGSAGAAGSASDASCLIPGLDPQAPPTALTLSGNLGTHDPAVVFADGVYYLFATGNGIAAKTSTDLHRWNAQPDVFSRIPSWVAGQVSGVTNIWAPDISFFGGMYHLYYAVSTFGSNKSCIGHATRASLSSGSFEDHGPVICSNVGSNDNWNAIDPNVVVDETGTPWMSFGSFWSGIKLIKLDENGERADDQVLSIAKNNSIEGPFIVRQCGYYYLFVSFGSCCNGAYDYNVRVGRSQSVTGPYVDKQGKSMLDGGGTQIVKGNSTWTAPGHNAILVTPDATYNFYHALNANHQNPTLRIAELALDADGWPVSGGP